MAMTRRFKAAVGALFAIVSLGMAQIAGAADVTGTWTMTVQTSAGGGSPTFILVQKGDAITGTYKGQFGEAPVTGTVMGSDVTLEYNVDAQGQNLTIKYTGKVDGKSITGKVSLGSFGDGTFSGTKQ
jgi:hypothetical protein